MSAISSLLLNMNKYELELAKWDHKELQGSIKLVFFKGKKEKQSVSYFYSFWL